MVVVIITIILIMRMLFSPLTAFVRPSELKYMLIFSFFAAGGHVLFLHFFRA